MNMLYTYSAIFVLGLQVVLPVPSATGDDCQCGKPADTVVSMRIVGGRRVTPHSHPWAVAILNNDAMHCGGSMITDRHVLSAGHCFKWNSFTTMEVLIGLDDLDNTQNVSRRVISKVIIHENFTSTTVRDENDIAIATINEPVLFGKTIIPICLPTPGQEFSERMSSVVGWGRMGSDLSTSKFLLKALVRILSDEECMKTKLQEHLKPTMMCAFSKGKDGCQGDSGGPLLVFESDGRYIQAGVVSWGIGCANPTYPGIYTKVSHYIEWIKNNSIDGRTCD